MFSPFSTSFQRLPYIIKTSVEKSKKSILLRLCLTYLSTVSFLGARHALRFSCLLENVNKLKNSYSVKFLWQCLASKIWRITNFRNNCSCSFKFINNNLQFFFQIRLELLILKKRNLKKIYLFWLFWPRRRLSPNLLASKSFPLNLLVSSQQLSSMNCY